MTKMNMIEKLEDLVREIELILTEKGKRAPTRFGSAFRWYLENLDTIKEIVSQHKAK
jgi:hypothetical protein